MADLIIVLAEILIVSSFMFKNVLILRILAALGMIGYVIAGFTAGYEQEGMKALIVFSGLAALINIIQIYHYAKENINILLPKELQEIHSQVFSHLNNSEFMKIYRMASKKVYQKNEEIIEESSVLGSLSLILDGRCEVRKNDKYVAMLSKGDFIGEMSYISGKLTDTAVLSLKKSVLITWEREKIEKVKNSNPLLYNKFFQCLSLNLVKKIQSQNIKLSSYQD